MILYYLILRLVIIDMDVQSPPSIGIEDMNNTVKAPIAEPISSVNLGTPLVEEVPSDQVYQMKAVSLDEEVLDWEFEEGDIQQMDYNVEPISPLGAYDKYRNYYADALPEDGQISLGGIPIPIKSGGYFEENGFSVFSPELKIGKVFPYMAYIPNDEYGKAFMATNYPELHQGTEEKTIYTDTRGEVPPVYMVMLTIVGYPNSVFPDKIENGQKINEIPQGFKIQTSGLTRTDTGYLGFKLFAVREKNGEFTGEDLGYLKGNKISINPEDLPEEIRIAMGLSS